MSNQIWMTGATQQALALAKEALTVGEATADRELIIAASYYLAAAALTVGDYPQIKDAFKKMFEWLPEGHQERFSLTGYPGVIAHAYLSWGDADCGHFDEAIVHGKLGLQKAEEIGQAYSRIWARFGLATTYDLQGEHEAGLELIEQSMEIVNAAGIGLWPMMLDWKRGHLFARAGRVPEGIALLRNSLEKLESVGIRVWKAVLTANLGEALLAGGQTGEARAAVDKALALARDQQERGHEAYALRLDAELLAHEAPNDFDRKAARFGEAMSLAESLGMRPLIAHCRAGLGNAYRQAGRHDAAQSHLDAATSLYGEMGMNYWLNRLEAGLR
jgi:tetratricopeptide (TPR) repeat protein